MNTKRIAQLGTIPLALLMLSGYVVHSQRAQTRSLAPGSKSQVIDAPNEFPAWAAARASNSQPRPAETLLPGSKALSPVFDVKSATSSAPNPTPARAQKQVFAPGSKSAEVFSAESFSSTAPPAQATGPTNQTTTKGPAPVPAKKTSSTNSTPLQTRL